MSTTQWRQPGNGRLSPAEITVSSYRNAMITAAVAWVVAVAIPVLPAAFGLVGWSGALPLGIGTIVAGGFGYGFWRVARSGRRDTVLLEESGVTAFGDVLSVQANKWSETTPGYEIEVRVSGPDITPFRATFKCRQLRQVQLGERLDVRVVPAAHLYQVRF